MHSMEMNINVNQGLEVFMQIWVTTRLEVWKPVLKGTVHLKIHIMCHWLTECNSKPACCYFIIFKNNFYITQAVHSDYIC